MQGRAVALPHNRYGGAMSSLFRCLLLVALLLPIALQAPEVHAQAGSAGADTPARALVEILRDETAREALIEQLLAGAEEAGVTPPAGPEPLL